MSQKDHEDTNYDRKEDREESNDTFEAATSRRNEKFFR